MHKMTFPLVDAFNAPDETGTLIEQAFRRLRLDVVSGARPAGEKLKVDELQRDYGFSSSPLREALNRLTQEGLVIADQRRGFRVAPIASHDFDDITRMRLMVDVKAIAESIRLGSDDWEADLVASFHKLAVIEERLSDGPLTLDESWSAAHRTFHLALISACGSERLFALCASLFDQAERYRRFSARHRPVARRKSAEHRRILEAAIARDVDETCRLHAEHIENTRRNVAKVLAEL